MDDHIGNNLRDFIRDGGSQKELADKLGKTQPTISGILATADPHVSSVIDLCHAADKRAYWFFASLELPKMPVEAFKILEEIFFLPQKKREFFLRQMIEIKKLMDEIEKEAKDSDNK